MTRYTPLVAFLLSLTISHAQVVTIENESAGNCSPVSVDVSLAGFSNNVGAITLYIDYDPAVLTYNSYTPGSIGGFVNELYPGRVGYTWFSVTSQNVNGLLFTMNFDHLAGFTNLAFDTAACEFTTIGFTSIYPDYLDGSVSSIPADTIYVDASVGSSGDGQSWATALMTIGEAAALPLKPGDRVLVKPGTYAEDVTITTNGAEIVPATTGVIISDTNKIQFPDNTNLACVDPDNHPGEFYAYVFRSWNSNNGYYPVIAVVDSLDYVIVDEAAFYPESGTDGDSSIVMAGVGRPVIYRKDPGSGESQRVVIDISGVAGATHGIYVGDPISGGATDASPADFNIIEGFDITGGSGARGLHIQSSGYNVFAGGKVYNNDGEGIYINGNDLRPARFNIIHDNIIFNTPGQAVYIGYSTVSANNNHAFFNHITGNEIYNSGFGGLTNYKNAIKIKSLNKYNVIDGNHIHDVTLNTVDNGAIISGSKTHHTLVCNNLIRNLSRLNTGIHAYVMIADSVDSLAVFNNILKREEPLANQFYAFRINGSLHNDSRVVFNSINNIPRGFYLEDYGTSLDVTIQNNIINSGTPYFQGAGTSGRFTVGYNCFLTLPGPPYGGASGDVIADPLFVSPASESGKGLKPADNSPCLNAGTAIPGILSDHSATVRIPAPSIGAYEIPLNAVTWTGAQDDDWSRGLNWDQNVTPTGHLDVIIPLTPVDPVIYRGNASARTLDVRTGATITLQDPYELNVGN